MGIEIYSGKDVLWRSGPIEEESYVLKPDVLGKGKYWPSGTVACYAAYSNEFQSMSTTCYDLNIDEEKPFTFN
jgi:hypothetical protein